MSKDSNKFDPKNCVVPLSMVRTFASVLVNVMGIVVMLLVCFVTSEIKEDKNQLACVVTRKKATVNAYGNFTIPWAVQAPEFFHFRLSWSV